MRLDSSGRLLIGHTTSLATEGALQQQITGTDFNTSGAAQLRFQDGTSGPTIALAHSRNATKGSHTILADNDEFGKLRFYGSDGTDFNNYGAEIRAIVNGTPGANDMPGALTFGTTADGATGSTERMRITSAGKLLLGTTTPQGNANADDFVVATTGHAGITIRSGASHAGNLFFADGVTGGAEYQGWITYNHSTQKLTLGSDSAEALEIDSSQNATFAGTVSDSKGDLRKIPKNDQTSAYTLVASDMGKAIYISSGGVTIPQNVLPDGAAVTIINNSGSDQTITQGSSVNLYNTADASTGNRTLAQRGMATVWFYDGSNAYISGAGLS